MTTRARPLATLGVVMLALAAATSAQLTPGTVTDEQKVSGNSGGFLVELEHSDKLGHGVAPLGDLDGDGRNEIVVGAPGDDDGGGSRGAVWILHPKANGTLETWTKITSTDPAFGGDVTNYDLFGTSVDVIGDLDDDGNEDLIVGAPGDDDACCDDGSAWIVFLNEDGSAKSTAKLSVETPGFEGRLQGSDGFGRCVAGLGDVDGDGVEDVAVGTSSHDDEWAPFWEVDTVRGAVFVFLLNADGSIKSVQELNEETLTAMGFPDVIADPGQVGSGFAFAVAGPGDLDGDGTPDLVVGGSSSLAVLFLAPDGSVVGWQRIAEGIGGFEGDPGVTVGFGRSVSSVGDIDGNGVDDLAAGAFISFPTNADAVWLLFMENDGTVRGEFQIAFMEGGFEGLIDFGDEFGTDLGVLGDLSADGTLELVIGAPGDDDDASSAGAVWVVSVLDGPWFDVGFGLTGSNNKPRLKAEGLPLDGELIELKLTRGLPGATANLVIGGGALFAPFKGGTLVPAITLLIPATVGPLGTIDLPALWPPGFPPGLALWFQWWIADPVGVQGFSASNGLQVLLP